MKKNQTLVELKTIVNLQNPDYDDSLSDLPAQDKIKFRRTRVNRLKVRGYSNTDIAKMLGCSLSTIEKDLQDIRKRSKKWYDNESVYDYCQSIQDLVILYDNVIEDLQILYNESVEVKQKLEILNKISEFEEKKLKLYTKTKSVRTFLEGNLN